MSPVLKAGPVSQARYEALHILVRVERDRAFADIALEHALDRARLDPRDAALCTEIVFGTLRWRRHLDWRLAPHLNRPLAKLDPWVRALLRLTAYQLMFLDRVPRWAAVDEAVSVARLKSREPGPAEFVNAVLRSLTRAPGPPRTPAAARRGGGRALVLSRLDRRALDRPLRNGGGGAPHGRAERAAAGDDPGEYPPDHPRGPGRASPGRGAGRDRSHRASSRGAHRARAGRSAAGPPSRRAGAPSRTRPRCWSPACSIHSPGSWWRTPAPRPAPRPPTWPSSWPTAAGSWPWTPTRPGYACVDRRRRPGSASSIVETHAGGVATVSGRWKGRVRSRAGGRAVLEPGRAPPQPGREVEPARRRISGAWPRSSAASCRRRPCWPDRAAASSTPPARSSRTRTT